MSEAGEPIIYTTELEMQLEALVQFDQNCQLQLLNAARADNNLLLAETKGMLRVTTMIIQQLKQRIEELKKDIH